MMHGQTKIKFTAVKLKKSDIHARFNMFYYHYIYISVRKYMYILSLPRKRPNLDVGMFGFMDVI